MHWSITPRMGRSARVSAINVPNSGRPITNDLVPSIGSSRHTNSASRRSPGNPRPRCRVPDRWRGSAHAGPARLAIGDRHRAGVGLALDGERRAVVLAHHRARRPPGAGRTRRSSGAGSPPRVMRAAGSPGGSRQRRGLVRERAEIEDHVGALLGLLDPGEGHLGAGTQSWARPGRRRGSGSPRHLPSRPERRNRRSPPPKRCRGRPRPTAAGRSWPSRPPRNCDRRRIFRASFRPHPRRRGRAETPHAGAARRPARRLQAPPAPQQQSVDRLRCLFGRALGGRGRRRSPAAVC